VFGYLDYTKFIYEIWGRRKHYKLRHWILVPFVLLKITVPKFPRYRSDNISKMEVFF